jgi:hypothetical protein
LMCSHVCEVDSHDAAREVLLLCCELFMRCLVRTCQRWAELVVMSFVDGCGAGRVLT